MGAILSARLNSALVRGASRPQAFMDGFTRALLVSAVIALGGAFAAAVTIRKAHTEESAHSLDTLGQRPGSPADRSRAGLRAARSVFGAGATIRARRARSGSPRAQRSQRERR